MITVEELKKLVEDMSTRRRLYLAAKKVSDDLFHDLDEAKSQVREALDANEMNKFSAPGIGTAYITRSPSVTVPKNPIDRKLLADHLTGMGLESMLSVNYNSLNSWFKEEAKAAEERGELVFKIPGLEDPVDRVVVKFIKE